METDDGQVEHVHPPVPVYVGRRWLRRGGARGPGDYTKVLGVDYPVPVYISREPSEHGEARRDDSTGLHDLGNSRGYERLGKGGGRSWAVVLPNGTR